MADNISVKDFRLYPPTSIPAVDGKVLMWNTNNNKLELINLSNISGGSENIPKWSSAPSEPYELGYPINYVVQYDNKIWASLTNNNLDNPPVTGSSFWVEVSKASVSNFSRWKAGIYSDSATMIVKDNGIYVLDKDVSLPFNSVDFNAELTAGTWVNPSGNEFNSIVFNTSPPPIITGEGTVYWNDKEYTIDIITGLGSTIQVGQETLVLIYNDTGVNISNFKVLHPIGAQLVGDNEVIKVEFADASNHEKCQGTLLVATQDIASGEIGFAIRFGKARGGDTSIWGSDKQLWLGTDGTGSMTIVKPSFPNFALSMGGTMNDSATDGTVLVSISTTIEDTFNDAWNGGIRESFRFIPTSNGSVVTGTLTNANPLLDLILFFSDVGMYTFDTTTSPKTIELILGTDTAPTTNYVYIPKTTKVLTVSTSGFPTIEHCKVAILEVESAATTQSQGGTLRNQNINDHIKKEDDNGHILHIAERIRRLNADHETGTEATLDATGGNGYISTTGGQVWQMHAQIIPAISMPTSPIRVVNNFTTPYAKINNLTSITAYSSGLAWNNKYGKIIIWGIANSAGQPCFLMCNIPSKGYNSESRAVADAFKYANYTIPKKYKGVGFLIAEFTIRISGGSITYSQSTGYKDLRGFVPNNIAGGGGGSGVTSLLALSDVFISTYAGKKGQSVIVNDLETGIITEAKNWIYNTARTFYSTISAALLTANRIHSLPNKSGTFALTDDITTSADSLPAYRYNFNSSILGGNPGDAKFAFNAASVVDATEMYISKNHYRSAGGIQSVTTFINDLGIGGYITSEGILYNGVGSDGYFEVKVLSNEDNGDYNTIGIEHTLGVLPGTVSPTAQFWFGFHQAAGVSSPVTPGDLEQWDPLVSYQAGDTYVSYVDAGSTDPQFQTEAIYRCIITTLAGENPESHPTKWEFLGTEATIEDYRTKVSSADFQKGYLFNKIAPGEEFTKEIGDPGDNETFVFKLRNWFFDIARDFRLSFNLESLSVNRVATWQNKDITVAGLDDFHPDPAITLSDEANDLVPAENDSTITLTRAQTFTAFSASVNIAPTAANILISVLLNGSSIATITIVAGAFFGTTTTISNTSGIVADKLKFDLTQVGATITGAGLKCYTLSNLI